ncbi:MAG: thioesterase domain-containing protein [Bacteriovoracaceae bacterium]|nr:thioesterase domain-containing protein [Bacteriovoracaceae bacterium]
MKLNDLREYLYNQIPLSKAMGLEITVADISRVEMTAPLELNSNHMDTAFGGSLATLLILTCYGYLFNRLDLAGLESHVLIKEGNTKYLLPVRVELKAICLAPDEATVNQFLTTFKRRGRARITLTAYVEAGAEKACIFSGEFVAVKA